MVDEEGRRRRTLQWNSKVLKLKLKHRTVPILIKDEEGFEGLRRQKEEEKEEDEQEAAAFNFVLSCYKTYLNLVGVSRLNSPSLICIYLILFCVNWAFA